MSIINKNVSHAIFLYDYEMYVLEGENLLFLNRNSNSSAVWTLTQFQTLIL